MRRHIERLPQRLRVDQPDRHRADRDLRSSAAAAPAQCRQFAISDAPASASAGQITTGQFASTFQRSDVLRMKRISGRLVRTVSARPGGRSRRRERDADRHHRGDKEDRPGGQNLPADEVAEIAEEAVGQVVAARDPLALEEDRRPAVLRVPDQHRRERERRDDDARPHLPQPQPAAAARALLSRNSASPIGRKPLVSLLASPSPTKSPAAQPPVRVASRDELGDRPERQRPEQHRGRVRASRGSRAPPPSSRVYQITASAAVRRSNSSTPMR